MDQSFFSSVGKFQLTDSSLRSDNDFADRLNYYYTTIIIVIFAVTISAKQYVGKPLQCWIPPEFTEQWEKYTENYCWIKNTYYLPLNATAMPDGAHNRRQHEINYYQYVPFILALMALGFNLPNIIWKILNYRTGINIASTIQLASSIIGADPDERNKLIESLAADLREKVAYQMDDKNRKSYMRGLKTMLSCVSCSNISSFGSFLTFSYIVTKLLFCLNSIGMLLATSFMLTSSYRIFDPSIFLDILSPTSWHVTGIFPRITSCDFEIRRMSTRIPYSIQCVLMINLFNEKIFAFLWIWFLLMSAANILSLVYWLIYCLSFKQKSFIADYLETNDRCSEQELNDNLDTFVTKQLKSDGIFILRLIASNSGHLVTTEVVHSMWNFWYARRPELENSESDEISV